MLRADPEIVESGGSDSCHVALISRNTLFRSLLRDAVVSKSSGCEVTAVSEVAELLRFGGRRYRLIILTVGPSIADDLAALRHMPAQDDGEPPARIMLFSEQEDDSLMEVAMACGCCGVIFGTSSVEITIAAIHLVLAGGTYFPRPPSTAATSTGLANLAEHQARLPRLLNGIAAGPEQTPDGHGLTSRERQVLRELCHGHPNKIIARNLKITENTAKMHVRRILAKLQVKNRTEAVILFKER